MIKRAEILALLKDRTAVLLLGFIGLGVFAVIASALFRVHTSDVQVPVRYSGYGAANIYRDQWYVLYIFPTFALLAGMLNSLLAVKIHQISRPVSLGIMGVTVFLLLTSLVVANAIFNLAPNV